MDKLQISRYKSGLKKNIIRLRGSKPINLFFTFALVITLLGGIMSQPVLQDAYHRVSLKMIRIFEYPLKLVQNIPYNFLNKFINGIELINLKRQNDILQHKLVDVMHENQRLKQVSHFALHQSNRFLSVDVIGSKLSIHYQFLFAFAGKNQGVRIGQPVFYQGFLVGVIDKITLNTCRICLISNILSRTPAYIHDQSHQGILYGDGHQTLHFELQDDKSDIYVGDLVYSSGIGGIYPAHKIIGKITAIENKVIKVAHIIDFKTIDTLQIILSTDLEEIQYLQKGISENDDSYL